MEGGEGGVDHGKEKNNAGHRKLERDLAANKPTITAVFCRYYGQAGEDVVVVPEAVRLFAHSCQQSAAMYPISTGVDPVRT